MAHNPTHNGLVRRIGRQSHFVLAPCNEISTDQRYRQRVASPKPAIAWQIFPAGDPKFSWGAGIKMHPDHGKPSWISAGAFVASIALIAQILSACSGLSQSAPGSPIDSAARYPDL